MTGIKVGDFVRFKSSIILDNPQISLTGDKAVVIGFSPDGKVARVVWSDGEPGEYRREKLDRCEGAIGRAVAAPRKPLRDWGHKPVPTPPRVHHAALPSEGNPNNYEGESYVVKYFSPGKQIDPKTGEEKDAMFPRFQHKIVVRCLRSGRVFVFTGTKAHKRAPWKYKGNGLEGLSVPRLQDELSRMMGEAKAHTVVAGVVGEAIPLAMFKMMFPEVAAA